MSDQLNRVKFTTADTGTGSSITVAARYSAAFFTPIQAGAVDGRKYTYVIQQGNDIEIQQDQVASSSGTVFARGTPVMSIVGGTVGTTKITLDTTQVISFGASAADLMFEQTRGADVVAAGTLVLDTTTGKKVNMTGSTTITAVTLADGQERWVYVSSGTPQITVGASLVGNAGGANITLAVGDLVRFQGYASSVVRFTVYRLSGRALVEGVTSVTGNGLTITNSGTLPEPFGFENVSFTASVNSNILTVALKDFTGSDPSATSPARIAFRSVTPATGQPDLVSVTGALSITTNATGATLGTVNTAPFRLWIVAFNNAGTVVLSLINCSTASQIFPLNEAALQSSTSISGSATSAGVFYSPNGTTVTSKAIKILGYVEYGGGLTTAGTYASAPTIVQIFGPGIKKPGEVVQQIYKTNSTPTTVTNNTPTATSLSQAITPTSAANLIEVTATGTLYNQTGGNQQNSSLYRGASTPIGNANDAFCASAFLVPSTCYALDAPGTASSVTYAMYAWSNAGYNTVWNQNSKQTTMVLKEIMG